MAKRDNQLAAKVLAEAHFYTDEKVANKYGLTRRTVVSYRAALKDDDELSQLYSQNLSLIADRGWADELSQTLTTALRKIGSKLEEVPAENLTDIAQMVGLTRELMELELSRKYAEYETRGDDRAEDLGAQQTQRTAPQADATRLLS